MQIKNKSITIVFILLFLASSILIGTPTANAADTRATFAYIGATPNPVNVGGETLLHTGITEATRQYDGWSGLTITVTRPDGKTETLGPFNTDSTGGTGTVYVPDTVGNYTLVTNFPKQDYRGVTYKASVSQPLTLQVVEEQIKYYPGVALPTEYWSRPIDSQAREWYTISGSWLVANPTNLFVPFNDGPESAHVLWTKDLTTGGLVGGNVALASSENAGPVGFETGDAYQGKWGSRFIISGVLIYTHHTSVRPLEYTAVDIHTGEVLWTKSFENLTLSMCQQYYFQSYNYMGTYSYMWFTNGSTWYAYDPMDTKLRITITNVPLTSTIVGERGDIYRYSYTAATGRFQLWNLSALISMEGSFLGPGPSSYDAGGSNPTTTAQKRAYAANFTFPTGNYPGNVNQVYLGDRIIGSQLSTTAVRMWGISLKEGQVGSLLFNNTWTPPAYWAEGNLTISGFGGGWMSWSQPDNIAILWLKESREHYAFSLNDGRFLWGPTEPQYYLDSIDDSSSSVRAIAYGRFYCASVSGIVYCYNVTTGARLWTYEATDPYTEILWSNNWWMKPVFITDGKIYVGHTEHSANQPLPRGAPFICLNATTGEEIWRVNGMFRQTRWGGRAIIGDSIIATMDTYDQRVYAIGRGPSALTVTAPNLEITEGTHAIISGTVIDVSPGTKQAEITARFSNGLPAISDKSQSDWMLYVYKQFEKPGNATGVLVALNAIDPNGNYITIGTTTSDASGTFGFDWATPEIPGKYTIIATFPGSAAYYPSSAQTYAVVGAAPEPTAEPTKTPPSMSEVYFIPAIAGLFVAIIVVGLMTIIMIRKQP